MSEQIFSCTSEQGSEMKSQSMRHPLSVAGFEVEVMTGAVGVTLQIFYRGRACGGMSDFGGTPKLAKESMVAFLRRLADGISSLDLNAEVAAEMSTSKL